MKWPGKKKGGGGAEAKAGRRRARRIWDRIPGAVQFLAAMAAIFAFAIAVGPQIVGVFEHQKPVEVELAEVTVSNPRTDYSHRSETEPAVTATVRNDGSDTAWVDEARITLLDGTRIATCFSQGGGPDVPHSKPYRVTMPEFPSAEKRVIRRPMHVEVQPGHGARPLLKCQKLPSATTDLYAIDVKYVVDPGEEILDAGRFVIGVPGPPDRGGYVIPESEAALTAEEFREAGEATSPLVSWCLKHNLDGVERLAAEPGRRSAEIAALSQVRPAPAWAEIEDHESPQEAVETLLGTEGEESSMYAVEAGEETGDTAYEEEVRKRAVASLLKLGEKELGTSATYSVGAAERALSFGPDEAASDLLAEAKVAATEQEEQQQKELEAEEATVAAGGG